MRGDRLSKYGGAFRMTNPPQIYGTKRRADRHVRKDSRVETCLLCTV